MYGGQNGLLWENVISAKIWRLRESHMVILKNIPDRGKSQSRSPKVFLESPRNSEWRDPCLGVEWKQGIYGVEDEISVKWRNVN